MIKLFSAPWCANCKPIKKYLEDKNIVHQVMDIDTEYGAEQATELKLRSIPVLVTEDGDIKMGSAIMDYLNNYN
jgi:glutaredoxin